MEHKEESRKANVQFAAIDQYVETNIVSPVEIKVRGKDFVLWGDGNAYPSYLTELYRDVTSLHSIIDGDVDYIAGDDVTLDAALLDAAGLGQFKDGVMNRAGVTIREQVKDVAFDLDLRGGFALEVIRNREGGIAEVNYLNLEHIRSNKENDVFYYCENWKKVGAKDVIRYPKFSQRIGDIWATLSDDEKERNISSLLFVKNTRNQVYPAPKFAAAVKACETERCTDIYHLNAINNNFEGSIVVNFNNGEPGDKEKKEITEDFEEKYGGYTNAGRIVFSFNQDRTHAMTFETPKVTDFGDRYRALSEHCRQQILSAFRVSPNLVGLPTATGFSQEEYESAFKLYNRTQIRPAQRTIVEAYEKIFGVPGILIIKPFSLESDSEQNVK